MLVIAVPIYASHVASLFTDLAHGQFTIGGWIVAATASVFQVGSAAARTAIVDEGLLASSAAATVCTASAWTAATTLSSHVKGSGDWLSCRVGEGQFGFHGKV